MGICAHSVAAAEDNHDLQAYVNWFSKAKKVPNVTKLATTEILAGCGRKGSVPPRKRKKLQPPESKIPFTIVAGLSTHESHTRDAAEISQSMSEERPGEQSQYGTVNVTIGSGSVTSQSSSAVAQSMVMTGGQLNIHPVHPPPSGGKVM